MLRFVALLVAGILLGMVSGLLPGLHPNTVAAILAENFSGEYFAFFIVAVFGAQVIFSFIPAIFFGIPDEETVVSVLPGHRMAITGRGIEALQVCVIAGVGAAIVSLLLLPLSLFAFPVAYGLVKGILPFVLLIALCALVLSEKNAFARLASVLVIIISGALGFLVLDSGISDPLFPLFSGLFAVSGILFAMRGNEEGIGKQKAPGKIRLDFWKEILLGVLLGFLADLLPGISSPAQMAILGGTVLGLQSWVLNADSSRPSSQKDLEATARRAGSLKTQDSRPLGLETEDPKKYLALIASIAVSQGVFAFASLESIGKARVGALAIAGEAGGGIFWMAGIFAISIGIAGILILKVAGFLQGFEFGKLKSAYPAILAYLFLAVFLVSGLQGIAVLCVSAIIGSLPHFLGVSRVHLMACIIIPTIGYYLL